MGQALGERRVLCIVDDFDELEEELYKGREARPLFLRLRSLIDRGGFAFVFVGSEKLPNMLRYQGERLNQIKRHSLDFLRDDAALEHLVSAPSRPHMEFSDGAVRSIGTYSAGNPYYATWICAEVYQDMYTRRDHYVAAADVERCIGGICREANVTNFQHLWTDGVFEAGPDTARIQYLNAAVAMACAEGEEGEESWIERGELWSREVLRRWDVAELELRLDDLVSRGVLLQDGGGVGHRIPLFRRWLRTGGVAAVRASFGAEVLETRLRPVRGALEPRSVVEVAENLVYDGHRVSEDRIRTWLEQFGMSGNQELALLLLRRLKVRGYFDDGRVRTSLRSLHGMVLEEFASQASFAQIVERSAHRMYSLRVWMVAGRAGLIWPIGIELRTAWHRRSAGGRARPSSLRYCRRSAAGRALLSSWTTSSGQVTPAWRDCRVSSEDCGKEDWKGPASSWGS